MEEIHGATDNQLIIAACTNDQEDWLDRLLAKGDFDINYTDDNGNTALHYCTKNGALNCLELLVLVGGIQINIKNNLGNTPLHYAVQYADDTHLALEMVSILLDNGADPRLKNKDHVTPLALVDETNEDMKDLLSTVLVYDDDIDVGDD
ncbi:ankyrin repeat-containing domain protein [Cunninghamella echinulata]|nr:ankyrin repeat-containing domain protein [Cunninghamella echinulata]